MTLERALVEVALADPDASVASLRGTCERVLVASEQQERLIEALLTLARGQARHRRRGSTSISARSLREVVAGGRLERDPSSSPSSAGRRRAVTRR